MPENYKDHLYALILAGGGGTRLWPKSRNRSPKQFLPLFQKKTLMQITVKRLRKILPWERIFCVTVSDAYRKEILREVPSFLPQNIIVEPARKDTGPAHGLGALWIYKNDPEAVIITESADRLVSPVSTYLKALEVGSQFAFEKNILVAMGVKARFPNIGYGHIKKGRLLTTIKGVKIFDLEKFVEKPPLNLAIKYTRSGKYYWNAGQFIWRAKDILASISKNAPAIDKNLKKIEKAWGSTKEKDVLNTVYGLMPKIAIDYAVAEKEKNFCVLEGKFHWTDIGDWKEVWENLPKDKDNNVIIDGDEPGGRVIKIDSLKTMIHTDGRLIAMIGINNLIVIDSKDALLICSKEKAQKVKQVVEQLKQEKVNELL